MVETINFDYCLSSL